MIKNAFERIIEMLRTAHIEDERVFSQTVLYKEGWMLRIILDILSEGLDYPPLTFQEGVRWFSEAKLRSPFRRRPDEKKKNKKSGRKMVAEGSTSVDGVYGHFDIRRKVGIKLRKDATQFVVIEAKMSSPLSEGVDYSSKYNQAARTVACMVQEIEIANISASDINSLGYYVIAPEKYLKFPKEKFSTYVDKDSISQSVENRIDDYAGREIHNELENWYEEVFTPSLKHFNVKSFSWKDIIDIIDDESVSEFHQRCLAFNK